MFYCHKNIQENYLLGKTCVGCIPGLLYFSKQPTDIIIQVGDGLNIHPGVTLPHSSLLHQDTLPSGGIKDVLHHAWEAEPLLLLNLCGAATGGVAQHRRADVIACKVNEHQRYITASSRRAGDVSGASFSGLNALITQPFVLISHFSFNTI